MARGPEVDFAVGYVPVLSTATGLPAPSSAVATGAGVRSAPRGGLPDAPGRQKPVLCPPRPPGLGAFTSSGREPSLTGRSQMA